MAASLFLIISSISLLFLVPSYAAPPGFKPTGIHASVRKNLTTLQYYATFQIGDNNTQFQKLFLDLRGAFSWFNCDHYTSSSYRPINCKSRKCKKAKGEICLGCNGTPKPGCANYTCGVYGFNPYINSPYSLYIQGLGEDNITVSSTDGLQVLFDHNVPKFTFSCGISSILEGLASGITGSLGLARTKFSFHKQISLAFNLTHKFSLCLPTTSENGLGDIFIGGGGPIEMPLYKIDISKSFVTTPLVTNPVSTPPVFLEDGASYEYFMDVKSINVAGKVVSLNTSLLAIDKNGVGGTKFSTVVPYTVLHTNIYKAIINEFVKEAASRKIKRIASVKPFGACFDSKMVINIKTGPNVPTIDLVLQSKDVYWRIYGHNSMVNLKEGVMCLAFIDGGLKTRTSIILGGHQLEDNIIQFDLVSSMFGFSNSLLLHNTNCSHYRLVL